MACQPFFCVKTNDNCNNSYWSFSLFNFTGDYDKKLKVLEQEVSTDVTDFKKIDFKEIDFNIIEF